MSQFAIDAGANGDVDETASLTTKITEAVAEAEGVDPIDLPSLYPVIDPDALEALFEPRAEIDTTTARVVFDYNGYEITVDSDGAVDIE